MKACPTLPKMTFRGTTTLLKIGKRLRRTCDFDFYIAAFHFEVGISQLTRYLDAWEAWHSPCKGLAGL